MRIVYVAFTVSAGFASFFMVPAVALSTISIAFFGQRAEHIPQPMHLV
jgi:hypothetical protein